MGSSTGFNPSRRRHQHGFVNIRYRNVRSNQLLRIAVNAIGPESARVCWAQRCGAGAFQHGLRVLWCRPYAESDLRRPLNVYGVSELAGESMVALTWERHFDIRTRGLYGVAGSGEFP